MMLPSKELMSKVLDREVLQYANGHYDFILNGITHTSYPMNIHELAHKCKEWAYEKGYELSSWKTKKEKNREYGVSSWNDKMTLNIGWICSTGLHYTFSETEPDAIFKACDYILKELSNK